VTQSFYRRPKIGAGDSKPAAPVPTQQSAPKTYAAVMPTKTGSESKTSYPGWLIAAKSDSPSSYPTMHGTYIGGSPCAGTFHSIN
jgi:hypothetical protein